MREKIHKKKEAKRLEWERVENATHAIEIKRTNEHK